MKPIHSLLCYGLLSLALAQGADQLKDVIKLLGHDDFKVRQKASDELMRQVEQDPEFAKKLKPFADDPDPEIRARIAELTKDLPVVLQWMDPAREKEVKSRPRSANNLKLTIKNRSKEKISVYWVDWNGERQSRGELKPGEERTIARTYVEHYWLIADVEGKGLGLYVPKEGKDSQIIHAGNKDKEAK